MSDVHYHHTSRNSPCNLKHLKFSNRLILIVLLRDEVSTATIYKLWDDEGRG